MAGKRKARGGWQPTAKDMARAAALTKALLGQAERDRKAGHKVTYTDDAGTKSLIVAVAAAYERAIPSKVARATYEAEIVAGTAPALTSAVTVRRADIIVGKAKAKVARLGGNDRPENAVNARLASWASVKGCAWIAKVHGVPATALTREADSERVILGVRA